ncbi:MAG TPA: helix-turn-helix domain-containing protein [Thermoanaerobaculia bacterium]|nr:helix-turn-helix domain-containing protein [Thermoanaerobaculia bacterium]
MTSACLLLLASWAAAAQAPDPLPPLEREIRGLLTEFDGVTRELEELTPAYDAARDDQELGAAYVRRIDVRARLFGINALLSDLGERFGRPALELSDRARVWMAEYAWPGNLRELRNVLERALVLESRAILDPVPPPDSAGAAPQLLAEVEAEAIRRALAHTRGRQGRAAELLGISRKTLWEKRRRYGIP